jgi:hypothetical protein
MRLIRISVLAAVFVLLAGCKPPDFDQTITCPAFHADHVAVYEFVDPRMLGVLYPDYSYVRVDKTECVVTRDK